MSILRQNRTTFLTVALVLVIGLAALGCSSDQVDEQAVDQSVQQFQDDVMQELDQADVQVQDLEAQLQDLDPQTQEQINQAITDIQSQRDTIEQTVQDLTDEASLQAAEQDINTQLEQLQQTLQDAQSQSGGGQ